MNLVVMMTVVLLLHLFLDGQFLSFGPEFISYYLESEKDKANPAVRFLFQGIFLYLLLHILIWNYTLSVSNFFCRLFPVLVRCIMKRFGASGKYLIVSFVFAMLKKVQ